MDLKIEIRLDEAAEIPLSLEATTGTPPIANRVEITWSAVMPDQADSKWYNGDELVLRAQLDMGQVIGMCLSPAIQVVGPHKILHQMMAHQEGELWADRIVERPGHTDARCIACGNRLFGAVAQRGACLSCFPLIDMDDELRHPGCAHCEAGPDDECTMDCPSRGQGR